MTKVTKTMREIQRFATNAQTWMNAHPERTKFSYALTRVLKRLEADLQRFDEEQEDAHVEHCLVDDKGGMLLEGNHYRFTKDGMKAKNAAVRELLKKTVEFEPYFAPEPGTLSEIEVLAFEGFVVAEVDDEELPVEHHAGADEAADE